MKGGDGLMTMVELGLPGVLVLKPARFSDARGHFNEVFRSADLLDQGFRGVEQINTSTSKKGVFRGLHLQTGSFAQAKVVFCVSGQVLDFAVDVDRESFNFGKFVSYELNPESGEALLIPRNYAHGFLSLSANSSVVYAVDAPYDKASEVSVDVFSTEVVNQLDLPNLILSDRDKSGVALHDFKY